MLLDLLIFWKPNTPLKSPQIQFLALNISNKKSYLKRITLAPIFLSKDTTIPNKKPQLQQVAVNSILAPHLTINNAIKNKEKLVTKKKRFNYDALCQALAAVFIFNEIYS